MKKLTSYHLKIIAIVTMVIDHSLKLFSNDIFNYMQANQIYTVTNYIIFILIIAIGRFSLPIFTYLIAEGCYYSHNTKKYISRLLLLGFISEIPFQYMVSILNQEPYQFQFLFQNIFFTLALGAIAIEGYRYFKEHYGNLVSAVPVIVCATIAQLVNTDYEALGVLLIFFWFYLRESKHWYLPCLLFSLFSYIGTVLISSYVTNDFYWLTIVESAIITLFSFLSIMIIRQYNHQRGKSLKWLFYIFYPLHITLLSFLYIIVH